MSSISIDGAAILARAEAGREAEWGKTQPLAFPYFRASASLLGIAVACATEFVSISIALHAQFPALSSGEDLGQAIMPLRYAMAVALPLGHIVLRSATERLGRPVERVINGIGLVPVLAILGGMAAFMFSATAQTTGGDDQELLAGLAGPALGIVCGALFSISFLASHVLSGKFLDALGTIMGGRAQRAKVLDIEREIRAADDYRTRLDAGREEVASKSDPDVLRRKAAMEAAGIVGRVAAEAHDLHISREIRGDVELGPDDTTEVPDMSSKVFDQRQRELKQYTTKFFLDQLTRKEA